MHSHQLKNRAGSVLLLTLLVVSLLLVLTLALNVTVRMSLKEVTLRQQTFNAQANAQVSLNLAIAQMQKLSGVDKRITTTAALVGAAENPHWTGVWTSDLSDPSWDLAPADPAWLVSGNGAQNPATSLSPNSSVLLVPSDSLTPSSKEVRVPLETISTAKTEEAFAWWIGDEGVKARVDLSSPAHENSDSFLRQIYATSPTAPDMLKLGAPWTSTPASDTFALNNSEIRAKLASNASLEMPLSNIPKDTLFHEVTVHSYGLPVNVKEGGVKADWSMVLDQSMNNSALLTYYLGASPTRSGVGAEFDSNTYAFPGSQIDNPERFFLSSRIGSGGSDTDFRPGPNLGILWHYGRLWQDAEDKKASLTGAYPKVTTDLRRNNWNPYHAVNLGENKSDIQHINSSISPVLSHLRFGIRLVTEEVPGPPVTYKVQLELKPLIGLWNPYSVEINPEEYLFESHITPMVSIRVTPPAGPSEEHTSFLREIWSGHAFGDERWLQLLTENVNFQPGEVRLFSIDEVEDQSNKGSIQKLTLKSNLGAVGYIRVDFRSNNQPLSVPAGSTIEILDVFLQDTQHPKTQNAYTFPNEQAMTWLTLKAKSGAVVLSRFTGLWNGGNAYESAAAGDLTIPQAFDDAASTFPIFDPALLNGSSEHLATWSFHLRTSNDSTQLNQRTRGWVDSNPRAPVLASFWDGDQEYSSQTPDGWLFAAPYIGEGNQNRGLVAKASLGIEEPDGVLNGNRYQGYLGKSATSAGSTHLALFDIPTAPLVSVGQFQHAQLGRYDFEPAFVAGNSYANVRIPLNQTVSFNHNGISNFDLYDISYDVNNRIWDEIFFSTLAPDYLGVSTWGSALEGHIDQLPNPRMIYEQGTETTSIADLVSTSNTDHERASEALAARIRILGAFNINSTSITAWKAVLSSMATAELPVLSPTGTASWESPNGIRFNRFGHVLSATPYLNGDANHEGFWQGWRQLSESELDNLATAIVEEVRARGPFRSFADFVNRDPDSATTSHRQKGALQAALDRTVNLPGTGIANTIGQTASPPAGTRYDQDAFDGESTSAGYASFLLQGDVLQSLAPILSVRSDTFTVRSYGAIAHTSDSTPAQAWCEAVVQRVTEYVDDTNEPWRNPVDDILSPINARFGRQFKIVSFRWLDPSEVSGSL